MKNMTKHRFFASKRDEWYTPKYVVEMLLPFLNKNKIIWCPFDNETSEFVKVFKENGFKVEFSHLENNQDFFKYEPKKWDIIISNPPFSLFNDILKRCYELKKTFCLLGIGTLLFSVKRFDYYKNYGIQIFLPKRRVKFTSPYHINNTYPNFNSIYFGWKIFPKEINYENHYN